MTEQTIKFRDPVVRNVVNKFVQRSDEGFEKYGRTLHDERTGRHKDLKGYLNDVQEELMDAILYLQAVKEEIQDLSEEALIQESNDMIYNWPEEHDSDHALYRACPSSKADECE